MYFETLNFISLISAANFHLKDLVLIKLFFTSNFGVGSSFGMGKITVMFNKEVAATFVNIYLTMSTSLSFCMNKIERLLKKLSSYSNNVWLLQQHAQHQ